MIRTFFWLASAVTAAFTVTTLVIFVCQWRIYFLVEGSTLHQARRPAKKAGPADVHAARDLHPEEEFHA